MKIVQLNDEQKPFFAALDPLELMDKKHALPTFCLGTAIPGETMDTPTGLMICMKEKDALVIRWLYVLPEYRGQDASDLLLSKAFEFAKKSGVKYVCAYLPSEYGRKFICPHEEEYFKSHAFDRVLKLSDNGGKLLAAEVEMDAFALSKIEPYSMFENLLARLEAEEEQADASLMDMVIIDDEQEEEKTEGKTVVVTAGDVAKTALIGKAGAKTGDAVGFAELTMPRLGRGIRRCLKKHSYVAGDNDLQKDLDTFSPDWFDMELSSCAMDGEEVCGLFLVHKHEDGEYWTEYLYDVSKNSKVNVMNMLKRSATIFAGYPADTKLRIRVTNKETQELVKKLFGK